MMPRTLFTLDVPLQHVSFKRVTLLTGLLLAASLLVLQFITHSRSRAQQVSLADRIAAQRAIEQVYWQHRLWPKDNPQPKPALDEMLPAAALEAKVQEYLRQSAALVQFWQRPLTAEDLQAEMERMAHATKQPEVLRELFAALGNDPLLIAECLARPARVERLVRERYEEDETAALTPVGTEERRAGFETWWQQARTGLPMVTAAAGSEYRLPQIVVEADACLTESWLPTMETGAPEAGAPHAALWTGNEMIIWTGRGGGRYNPVTDSWALMPTTGAPGAVGSAIWTGTEMIIWGGYENNNPVSTGGRYNPATNNWRATSTTGAPSARADHRSVWTGSEMIVWGGSGPNFTLLGGKYNPSANTWAGISATNAPEPRTGHSAVWTGSEMIVWGGGDRLNTGGRYNPATDSWRATTLMDAPSPRADHTATWTGTEMIIFGGRMSSNARLGSGGRYNPVTDSWTTMASTEGAADPRSAHTAVWTGSEMIIWGGDSFQSITYSGRRYNPTTNAWTAMISTNEPSRRRDHSAVWTGNEMIVWGGYNPSGFGGPIRTGGIYTPSGAPPIAPLSQAFGASGGTGSINVPAPGGCNWTAISQVNWITISSGASGAGNGMVSYAVTANPDTGSRSGIINVAGRSFTVTQVGCIFFLSPANQSFEPSGGTGTITVTTTGTCNWVASSNANWLRITAGNSGSSTGTISYSVEAHASTSPRTGIITVGGQTFTVTQAAGIPTLTTLNPNAIGSGSAAFSLTLRGTNFVNASVVKWNGSDRATTFISNTQLTAAIPAADVAAAGTANVTVFNPAPSGGTSNALSFAVVNCTYAIAPTSQSFSPFSSTGSVSVTTESVCNWTASSNANWLTLTSGSSGTGNGRVNYRGHLKNQL